MKRSILIATVLLSVTLLSNRLFAQTAPAAPAPAAAAPAQAGGDVVAALTSSDNYTALSIAIRAANLAQTLEGTGPFTIFAPTNTAFGVISSTKLDSLIKDPVKLATVLKFHVVSGKLMKADIIKALTVGKGKTSLKTIEGDNLTLSVAGGKLQLADDHGNTALVTAFDLGASNGVIHGLNAVLVSK